MSYSLIADDGAADRLRDLLGASPSLALDCEAAGFHRYSDRLCLIQITVSDHTFVLDPLALDVGPLLRPVLEDPGVEVVMHGADYDVRLLDRDLGIRLRGLFDTQVAAALLGEESVGLASLLEKHLGVSLMKKYQRADWAQRPLPAEMLEYAASDTQHLHDLADLLKRRLESEQRSAWAEEELRLLEEVRWEENENDPVERVRGVRDLPVRAVAALREALAWRDRIARQRDRAPFRVAGDQSLIDAVLHRPDSVAELGELKGFNRKLARTEGESLLERLRRVDRADVADLEPLPPRSSNGRGRPPPEVEDRMDRLKAVRNGKADALSIGRGTLLPNAVLMEIAWSAPISLDALREVPGIRRWQVEAVGRELVDRIASRNV